MELITIQNIIPKYIREKPNNVAVFEMQKFESHLSFKPVSKQLVVISPGGFGGNHKHKQIESWVAFGGEMEIVWSVGDSNKSLIMNLKSSKSTLSIFTIQSFVPHAIRNISKTDGYLIEWADMEMTDLQEFDVIGYPSTI